MSLLASPVNPGEILAGKYRIERAIGQGGMGVVVAARHLELDQTVAIKFLVRDAPPNALERFMREAKAAALVKSEYACRVHDFGRLESGEPYIVMEYLEGSDLADKLEREGPQPVEEVVGWIIQACDALSSAHAQGIVHRDLKPANLFLQQGSDGPTTLKVVDFGISKLATSGALTSTAVLMGSPLYMSPEQLASSRDVDSRSDIWSVGVVLYELLTGVPPFMGETLVQIVVQAREHEPVPLRELRPDAPPELQRVISKCLAKSPSDRYASINALAVDLAPFAGPEAGAIVAKLAKRAGRSSDPALVLSKTIELDPAIVVVREEQKTRRDTPNSRSGDVGARTPPEVEPPPPPPERRKRPPAAVLVVGFAVVTSVAIAVVATRKPHAGTRILQETTLSSSSMGADSAPLTVVMPLTSTATSTSTSSVPASSSAPRLVVPPGPQPTVRTAGRPSSTPTPRTSAPPVLVASPPASSGPKRRDLDRDYQP